MEYEASSNSPGLYAKLQAKAEPAYSILSSTRTRVAAEILRDWLKAYRRGGFDALLPKGRADRGGPCQQSSPSVWVAN